MFLTCSTPRRVFCDGCLRDNQKLSLTIGKYPRITPGICIGEYLATLVCTNMQLGL